MAKHEKKCLASGHQRGRLHISVGKKRINARVCDTFWTQNIGLMFRRGENALLSFGSPVRYRIHGWFCAPLQLLYLDERLRIIELGELRLFGTHRAQKPYWHVLELSDQIPAKIGERLRV
ncbi:DUF192 domain-containing protein [Candidatus Woesearchaeota archaeon]|nr:DUF192 domain-containing protein [Candidatus Woesearchaeota archaeon]